MCIELHVRIHMYTFALLTVGWQTVRMCNMNIIDEFLIDIHILT